jgi:hypothetical protein
MKDCFNDIEKQRRVDEDLEKVGSPDLETVMAL